ncbi:MAG: LytR C-terminal domain-containing protein [Solirubrobacterales bacterium]
MSSLLKDVGALAGLASFLGLALLALLYFAQARDLRRLREQASFLVEGGQADGESVAPAERTATAVATTTKEPEKAAAAAAATAPNEAEAFRRAELARQAAQRRQRFEQRRRGPDEGRERPSWLSEPASLAVIVVGVILLLAGIAFGVTRLTGGGSSSTTPTANAGKGPCPPGQTKVAVLNGTATPGLAAQSAAPLKQHGYKVGPVGNTSTPFTTSVVMFDPTDGQQCAPIIGQVVGIQKTQPMNNEVRQAAEGDPVAVVLGDDKAGASSGTGASGTTGSGI